MRPAVHEETLANPALLRLAERDVWWTKPDIVVATGLPRLVVSMMELGTWEDAHELLEIVGPQMFIDVLKAPPPRVISAKSLAVWHNRLGLEGEPPKAGRRTFGEG